MELEAAFRWAVPGGVPSEQDKEDDTAGPDIHQIGAVACAGSRALLIAQDDLGGDIGRASAECGGEFRNAFVFEEGCETEVGDFEVPVRGQKHVLGFDVAMADAFGMHVSDGADQLGKVDMGNVLADALVSLDFVEQVPAIG